MISAHSRIEKKIKVADFFMCLGQGGITQGSREPSEDDMHQTRTVTTELFKAKTGTLTSARLLAASRLLREILLKKRAET
jgi:hypothetical protein